MRKFGLMVAAVTMSIAVMAGCGKKTESISAEVVSSVSESTVSLSASVEVPEEEPAEGEYYHRFSDMYEELFQKTREVLVAEGSLGADEQLFYSMGQDYKEEPYEAYYDDDREEDDSIVFFTFGESGIDKTFVTEYIYRMHKDKGITAEYVRTIGLKEYEVAHKGDEYADVVPYDYGNTIEASLCKLRTGSLDELRAFIDKMGADYGLTRDSRVYDYIRLKAEYPDAFMYPNLAAKVLLPFLEDADIYYVPFYERYGALLIKDDTGERMISMKAVDKTEAGDYLYSIGGSVSYEYEYENALKTYELLETATPEILAEAYSSFENAQNDYNSAAGQPSKNTEFFLAGEADGGKAKLYGLVNYNGYLLLLSGKTYPLYTDLGMDYVLFFDAHDYDGDGEKEYAFSINDGRGTGFWTEELFVVDPGDGRLLTQFDECFDMHLHNECPYDLVKYEIDGESGVMTAWIEKDGARYSEISLEDKAGVKEIYFGDIFRIYAVGDKLFFEAECGMRSDEGAWYEYENTFVLRGELHYKEGMITYDNLSLCVEKTIVY
ncbi:MAG: hypothetical protein IKR39_04700 [Lachnospiraceae bacterium]|nr:hypothetical protein [Lachnospiraceae bacterium]